MEFSYNVLSSYNKLYYRQLTNLPEWAHLYSEDTPPAYWSQLMKSILPFDRSMSCFEIGSGCGDILVGLWLQGFRHLSGCEFHKELATVANHKIEFLCHIDKCIIENRYPFALSYTPDILIQMNCQYFDGLETKHDLLKCLWANYTFNGIPKVYFLEIIKSVKDKRKFPIRSDFLLQEEDIIETFNDRVVTFVTTYDKSFHNAEKILCIIQ